MLLGRPRQVQRLGYGFLTLISHKCTPFMAGMSCVVVKQKGAVVTIISDPLSEPQARNKPNSTLLHVSSRSSATIEHAFVRTTVSAPNSGSEWIEGSIQDLPVRHRLGLPRCRVLFTPLKLPSLAKKMILAISSSLPRAWHIF